MCVCENVVLSCGHVVPTNIWYCSASNSRQNHIFRRCCSNSFPNSHDITDTADDLCSRCQRLHLRAQEQWQDCNSPICFTRTGRYTILSSLLGAFEHLAVWLRYYGFSNLGSYFEHMGFTLPDDKALDQGKWEDDGLATPTWQLKHPDLAEVYPIMPGPHSSEVDLLRELQALP